MSEPRFKTLDDLFKAAETCETEEILEELTDMLHDAFSMKATELCNHGAVAVIGGLCLLIGPTELLRQLNDEDDAS